MKEDKSLEFTPRPPETMDDFRATATAFSQLTGVLGGFSMTILVLVLGLTEERKTARDWTVGLLLIAAVSYIVSSGFLANCMNVGVFSRWSNNPKEIFKVQRRGFNNGITLFHIGNIFLPTAVFVTVYQESLLIGLIASIVILLLAAYFVIGNLIIGPILVSRRSEDESIHDDTKVRVQKIPDVPSRVEPPAGDGLGWPSEDRAPRR
jgi:hypothetical protein